MESLRNMEVANERVLLRADFNVPLSEKGEVEEKGDWRLEATLSTINYLLRKKAKLIIIAHLGRPHGKTVARLKLDPVAKRLSELLHRPVVKLENCLGEKVERTIEDMSPGDIILLENIRFYAEEKENDPLFAKKLAELGDIYVNDAFGTCHRAHASIVGIPKYLPKAAGFLLDKEIRALSRVLEKPVHPLTVIIGGAKISTKIKVIQAFLERVDNLILGGALANTVISAKGFAIGKSVSEKEMIEEIKKLKLTDTKLHIPLDAVVSKNSSGKAPSRVAPIGKTKEEEMILDVGPDTCRLYSDVIKQSKMIIWNGPMGLFEVGVFASGSIEIAKAVAQSSAFSVVGGGDTARLLEDLSLVDEMNHISTGGGAMLKFLAGEELPGLKALK